MIVISFRNVVIAQTFFFFINLPNSEFKVSEVKVDLMKVRHKHKLKAKSATFQLNVRVQNNTLSLN